MKNFRNNRDNRKITFPESLVRMFAVTIFAVGILLATSCQMNMNKQDQTTTENKTVLSD